MPSETFRQFLWLVGAYLLAYRGGYDRLRRATDR